MGVLENNLINLKDHDGYRKICIYGPAGAGKTSLAATAPKPIFFDYERSTDSITAQIAKGHIKQDVFAVRPRTLDLTRQLAEETIKDPRFETIVIDTMSRMQKIQMMLEYIPNHPSVKSGNRDRFTTYLADFGYSANILDDFLMWLIEQPINVIILTHVVKLYTDTKQQDGTMSKQVIGIEPNLTPKLRESATELFSVVGYLTNDSDLLGRSKRLLRVNGTSIIVAKNRLHIQEQTIENPTYEGLFTS